MKTLPRRVVEWLSRRLALTTGMDAHRKAPASTDDAPTPEQQGGSRAGEETVGVGSQRTPVHAADRDVARSAADASVPDRVELVPPADPAVLESLSGPAECIEHFEIRRVLGHGGSGSVFLAHDTKLDRMVALKLLDKLDKPSAREMLSDETRAASKLRHPNLVTVFQSGEHDRGCYIVFEYIPGPGQHRAHTLREMLRERQQIPPREAVSIMRQIAAALAHAHAAGVVHRDVKPENILVDYKGSAFLADFGCARRHRKQAAGVRSFVGTIPYMSVEQIEGRWNAQTDIWSAGVVLYEMLSGERPFAFAERTKSRSAAEATFSFAAAIVGLEQLSPIPGVDADLTAICRTCLEKNPRDRYDSAAALDEDLARWQRNEPVSCRRVGTVERIRRWAQRNPLVAAQLAAIAAILTVGTFVSSYFAVRMWQARETYVNEQITQLDQGDAALFETVVQNLQHKQFQALAVKSISSRWQSLGPAPEAGKLVDRLAAAIVTIQQAADGAKPDPGLTAVAKQHLRRALLAAGNPDEFALLRRYAFADHEQGASQEREWIESLWETARNADKSAVQFRALAALARYDPLNESWSTCTGKLAEGLLEQDEREVAAWAANLSGFADELAPILKDFDSENEARRTAAAIAYATLTRAPQELAKRIVTEESPDVVRELLLQVQSRLTRSQAEDLLNELESSLSEATARQRANLTAARLFLAGPEAGDRLPIFAEAVDRLPRYLFERDARAYGLTPYLLLAWVDHLQATSADVRAMQTALLALGRSDLAHLPDRNRDAIVNNIASIYRDDRANVHSAAAWVLQRWAETPPDVDKPRHGNQENSWRINRLGQLMVRVTMPDGSPAEVSAYEVTLGEYAHYVRARAAHYGPDEPVLNWIRKPIREHFGEDTQVDKGDADAMVTNLEDHIPLWQQRLPIRHVSALQAAAYCVWASQQEGLSESQMGFRLREGIQREGSTLLDAIEQNLYGPTSPLIDCPRDAPGYRLPFAHEWEHLFDQDLFASVDDPTVLDQLGWYVANSQQKIWPVGGKRPDRMGVFDTAGNITEWCIAGIQETHVEIDVRGSSYESPFGKIQPLTPLFEISAGHRAIGFRMLKMLE